MADAGGTGGGEKREEDGTTYSPLYVDQEKEGEAALLDHATDWATDWRIATEAAGQGGVDVIRDLIRLATSAGGHAVLHALTKDAAPILAAASAGHLDIVELLLPLYTTGGSLPLRGLLTNAAASGNLDLLKYLFSLSSASRKKGEEGGWGGYSRRRHPKYDLLEGAHSAAAAGGHVHILEWLWGREDESEEEAIKSDSPRCRFKPAEYTELILGNRTPTQKDAADRIRVLEWVISTRGRSILSFEKIGGGEIVGKMAARGSVTVLRWILNEHVASKRKNWGDGIFPFYQMATAAASHGHVDVLEIIASHRKECKEATDVLRAAGVISGAICNGHVDVVRWLFEEVGPNEVAYGRAGNYRNLPALAFQRGQVGVLEFLYAGAGVPYGEHPASVHSDAEEFFWDHAGDWEAGIFPEIDIKPAARAQ